MAVAEIKLYIICQCTKCLAHSRLSKYWLLVVLISLVMTVNTMFHKETCN